MLRFLSVVLLLVFPMFLPMAQAEPELNLVSPYSVAFRSAVVPGWGQMRIGHPVQGVIAAAMLGGTLVGALITRSQYLDIYNDEYASVARVDPDSPEAISAFERANQRFKMSQFFVFAAVGVWAYGVVDSYVGAHVYNAEVKAGQLDEQSKLIDSLSLQLSDNALNAFVAFRF